MSIPLPATRSIARASMSAALLVVVAAILMLALLLAGARALFAADVDVDVKPERPALDAEALPGGATTLAVGRRPGLAAAYSNLSLHDRFDLSVGRAFFRDPWVAAPSSTTARDGLGPLFNAHACASCHAEGGRGSLGPSGEATTAVLLRLARVEKEGSVPDPLYGDQLQTLAIARGDAKDAHERPVREGKAEVTYVAVNGSFPDGTSFSLRKPQWRVVEPAYGPLDPTLRVSPRLAPSLPGAGLLEAIPEAALLARADPDDRDGDGISGRPNLVRDVRSGATVMGRFGWKALQPTVRQQVASALRNDIGITSDLYAEQPCSQAQEACLRAPSGGDLPSGNEISAFLLDALVRFTATLAVATRAHASQPRVREGRDVFDRIGCAGCHTPSFVTDTASAVREAGGQRVWPYSDLLLHDMGRDLGDDVPEAAASGSEWRTAPLWGLGSAARDATRTSLLHDGRARSVTEAILWHGGEARRSRDAFVALPRAQREALAAFLESL